MLSVRKCVAVGTVVVIFNLIALPPSVARPEVTYVHAGDLYRLCTADNEVSKSWCDGFISGELEIISNAPVAGINACVPPLTTLQQGVAIAEKWLAEHPDQSTLSAASVVARALADAFPCKSGGVRRQ